MVSSSSRLSQYDLLGELGRGGSSVVYAARDTLLERDVAVKILNVETAADRPQREVQAAATLNHPGIARIYEAGEDNGRRFIAMELIRGSTLGGILEKGPLPIEIALDYSRQILNALEAAHSASVVHRDLKPSNIMVQSDGRTKIVDFGLAKVTSPANGISMSATTSLDWSRITAEGSFAGTLAYMSPEQAEGKAVDARSDIFSFGAVLYEMLTGTSPFARESPVATMVAVMSHNPERDAAIPAAIWPILERTLRKDPLERWKSAGDLSYSLQIAIGPDSIEEAIRTRGPQPSRRRFLWWSAGLGSLAAAAGFVAGRGTTHRTVPTFEQLTFDSGAIQTARFGSDGQSAYVAFRAPGSEKYEVCEIEFGARSLKKLDLPAGYIQGLSTKGELALVLQTSSAMLARASRHGGPVKLLADQTYYASWAPDGDTVMAVRNLPAKGRIEYPLGTVLAEADSARGFPFQYANLSRGGRKIAYFRPEKHSRHEELVVIDVGPPASPARLLSSDWAFTSPLHWTSDDSAVWFSGAKPGRHSGIWSVDLRGNERCLIEAPGQIILQDIRSSDGAALIASHDQKTSIRVESADGNLELELPGSMLAGMSDDGSTFMTVEPITGSQSHTLFLFVKRNRAPVRVGECQVASLSRDGNFVATATLITGDGGQRLLIIPVGPGAVQDVTKPGFFWEVLDWFGDGRRIMATGRGPGTDRKTFVLSLEDHSYVPIDTAEAWGERISLDGQRLLMHNLAGERSVMDLSSRRITRLDIPSDAAELTWSADGKSIFFADKAGSDSGVSIRRLDVNSGESTLVRKTHVRGPVAPVGNPLIITPDGAHVAYLSSETNSTLYMIHGLS